MEEGGFLRSARLISACTLLSRILGLVRDILCANIFGAKFEWDAFSIAFRIPNLFRRLFGEGALSAAFIPAFVHRLEHSGKDQAIRLLSVLATALVLFLSASVFFGYLATFVLPAASPTPKMKLICGLLQVMLPYLVFICAAAILGAALNSLGHFFTPAFAPVLLNVVWIGALVGIVPRLGLRGGIYAVAAAILIGGFLEMAIMIPALAARKALPKPRLDLQDEGLREVGTAFFPVVFGLALVQINEVVDSIIAELCVPEHGAVSALYYGNQLTQLPLAIIGTALATAVFPLFSTHIARRDSKAFAAAVQKALRVCLVMAIPASVGMVALAPQIIQMLFEHGRFDAEATRRAAGVLMFYASAVWCYSANQIQVRAFYAQKDTRTPVRVSASMVFLNLALNLILVWPLHEAGLALSTAFCGLLSFLILNRLLRRRYPALDLAPVLRTFAKSLGASILMAVAAWALYHGVLPWIPVKIPGAVAVTATIGISGTLYFALMDLFHMEERRDILEGLFKRRRA